MFSKALSKISSRAKKFGPSSTLYTAEMKEERKEWFAEWLTNHKEYRQEEILEFHQSTDKGTEATTLKMKRPFVETVSVTSVKKRRRSFFTIYRFEICTKRNRLIQSKSYRCNNYQSYRCHNHVGKIKIKNLKNVLI